MLLTEAVHVPPTHRERMTQIMFETFNVNKMAVTTAVQLSLHASGRHTGVIVDVGDGVTQLVPIMDQQVLQSKARTFHIGGAYLTDLLMHLLTERAICPFTAQSQRKTAMDIKEKLTYVASDFYVEMGVAETTTTLVKTYALHDKIISLNTERFQCPEALFNPSFVGFECPGLHLVLGDVMQQLDPTIRNGMYGNILLSGGTSLCPGLGERLKAEIDLQRPTGAPPCHVISPPDRHISAWIGGSRLASQSLHQSNWVTKDDYDEVGPAVVHKRCI